MMPSEFIWKIPHLKSQALNNEEQPHDPEARDFHQWWRKQPHHPPKRDAFDILDHRHLATRLFLYEILEDGKIRYRLHGDAITLLAGKTNAGQVFDDTHPDPSFSELARYIHHIKDTQLPHITNGLLTFFDKKHVPFESIDAPLCDATGDIKYVIGLISPNL